MADHTLISTNILTGAPTIGAPVLSVDVDVLVSTDILIGAPIIGSPSLGSDHALTSSDILIGTPVMQGSSAIVGASYGVKYRFSFTSQLGILSKVEVKKKNYIGGVNTVEHADAEPYNIRREPQNANKLKILYGTIADIRFKSIETFEYKEFLAQSEDEYLVSIYHNTNLFWSGFVLPDLFSLGLVSKPVISLRCADMLSIVSKQTFAMVGGERFGDRSNLGTYLSHFFRLVNTDIDTIYDGTDIRETTSTDFTTSFLSLYYYHADAFKKTASNGDVTWFTWGEFIDAVLEPIGCTLEQVNGAYHITRVEAKKSSYGRIPITNIKTTFDYGTAESYNPVIEWPKQSIETYTLNQSATVQCDDIYKEQIVDFDTGTIVESAVVDGDFALDEWNISTLIQYADANNSRDYHVADKFCIHLFDPNSN